MLMAMDASLHIGQSWLHALFPLIAHIRSISVQVFVSTLQLFVSNRLCVCRSRRPMAGGNDSGYWWGGGQWQWENPYEPYWPRSQSSDAWPGVERESPDPGDSGYQTPPLNWPQCPGAEGMPTYVSSISQVPLLESNYRASRQFSILNVNTNRRRFVFVRLRFVFVRSRGLFVRSRGHLCKR